MTALLDAALWCASHGVRVFPLRPRSKKPLLTGWPDAATTEADTIREWWTSTPDANIGAVMGERFDIVDLDSLDAINDTRDLLGGTFPAHLGAALTPCKSGLHFWVPATGRTRSIGIRPGVDWLGSGGYAVVPPSYVEWEDDEAHGIAAGEGAYQWVGAPDLTGNADAAPWLALWGDRDAKASQERTRPRAGAYGPPRAEGASPWAARALAGECAAVASAAPGTRNNTLNTSAFKVGQLVPHLLTEAEANQALADAARACGLPDREAAATIASGLSKGQGFPRHPEERAPREGAPRRPSGPEDDPRIDPETGEFLGDEPGGAEPSDPGPDPMAVLDREIQAVLAARGPDRWARYEQARRTLGELVARGLLDAVVVAAELDTLADIARDVIVPLSVGSDAAFPVDALPKGMAAAVREVADAVQVDPAIPATAFLGAAAGAVGAHTRVVITETWSRWANLYLAVVADSGDGKSPGFAPALAPLESIGERLREEADEAKRRAHVMLPMLRQQLASMQKGNGLLADMLVLQEQVEEAEGDIARDARAVVDDVTPERLAQLLADNGGVLTAWNDEGALLGHMLGLYAQTPNLDVFLKAWDGSTLTIDRKGGNGTPGAALVVKAPRLTVVSAVQPAVVARLGEPRHRDLLDRGVVGRLLIAWPASTAGKRMLSGRAQAPYRAVPAWNATLAGMATAEACEVVFAPDAQRAFLVWHDRVESALPLGRAYGEVRPFAVKVRDAVPRLAGLFARLEGRRIVGTDDVSRAVALGEYYLTHAGAVVESWAGGSVGVARRILAAVHAKVPTGEGVTRCSECPDGPAFHVRDAARWVRRVPTEELTAALEVLEQHGYVRPLDPEEGYGAAGRKVGKKSPHVVVNPRMFVAERQEGAA